MPAPPPPLPPLRWVELTPDFRCNQRCIGCFAVDDHGASMTPAELAQALAQGRRDGADALWIGGGEPTLRRDLFSIAREARRVGYRTVRVQTNAMMFSYPEYTKRAVEAGVTELAVAIKGATAATHDRLVRTQGAFAHLLEAVALARQAGLGLSGDVLCYRSNLHELPQLVVDFRARGLTEFRLWTLSATVSSDADAAAEVPSLEAMAAALEATLAAVPDEARPGIVALHLPRCLVPASHRDHTFDARAFAMRIVNPGGHAFRLEESPMEGGHYGASCAGCAARVSCAGVRAEVLAREGERALRPLDR